MESKNRDALTPSPSSQQILYTNFPQPDSSAEHKPLYSKVLTSMADIRRDSLGMNCSEQKSERDMSSPRASKEGFTSSRSLLHKLENACSISDLDDTEAPISQCKAEIAYGKESVRSYSSDMFNYMFDLDESATSINVPHYEKEDYCSPDTKQTCFGEKDSDWKEMCSTASSKGALSGELSECISNVHWQAPTTDHHYALFPPSPTQKRSYDSSVNLQDTSSNTLRGTRNNFERNIENLQVEHSQDKETTTEEKDTAQIHSSVLVDLDSDCKKVGSTASNGASISELFRCISYDQAQETKDLQATLTDKHGNMPLPSPTQQTPCDLFVNLQVTSSNNTGDKFEGNIGSRVENRQDKEKEAKDTAQVYSNGVSNSINIQTMEEKNRDALTPLTLSQKVLYTHCPQPETPAGQNPLYSEELTLMANIHRDSLGMICSEQKSGHDLSSSRRSKEGFNSSRSLLHKLENACSISDLDDSEAPTSRYKVDIAYGNDSVRSYSSNMFSYMFGFDDSATSINTPHYERKDYCSPDTKEACLEDIDSDWKTVCSTASSISNDQSVETKALQATFTDHVNLPPPSSTQQVSCELVVNHHHQGSIDTLQVEYPQDSDTIKEAKNMSHSRSSDLSKSTKANSGNEQPLDQNGHGHEIFAIPDCVSQSKTACEKQQAADSTMSRHISEVHKEGTVLAKHYQKIGRYLYDLYKHDTLTDTILEVDNYTFTAHSVVLSCFSEYIATELTKCNTSRGANGQAQRRIVLNSISPASLQVVLNYMYKGDLDVNAENVSEVLSCAATLIIPELVEHCHKMISEMSPIALLDVVQAGLQSRYSNIGAELKSIDEEFQVISWHFLEIIDSQKFKELDSHTVCALLSRDDLRVESEADVATAAFLWLNHSDERLTYAEGILLCVRFLLLTTFEIMSLGNQFKDLVQNDTIRQILHETLWYRTFTDMFGGDPKDLPNPREYIISRNTNQVDESEKEKSHSILLEKNEVKKDSQRKFIVMPDYSHVYADRPNSFHQISSPSLLVFGGFNQDVDNDPSSAPGVERYDIKDNRWEHVSKLPTPLSKLTIVKVGADIYMIGGCDTAPGDRQGPTNKLYQFHEQNASWCEKQSLITPRMYHVAVEMFGLLYAIGGQGHMERILSETDMAECYNPKTNNWSSISPPRYGRMSASALVYHNYIFVAGGYGFDSVRENANNSRILNSVECYCPATDSWSEFTSLRIPRANAVLAAVGNMVFTFGGATTLLDGDEDSYQQETSVDLYDELEDVWHQVSMFPSNKACCETAVAVQGNDIFIVGGMDFDTDKATTDVHSFNVETFEWTKRASMPKQTAGAQCVLMEPNVLH